MLVSLTIGILIMLKFLTWMIHQIIMQALEMSTESDNATVILDVDVFKLHDFELDDPDLWPTFEQFRDEKNRIFFESITEDTARLFE